MTDRVAQPEAGKTAFGIREVTYAGRVVALADLPEYNKFYRKLAEGRWESHTFDALGKYLDRDTVLVDIGAWIGVTPFWSAQIAKAVVAVEPDPKCAAILKRLAETRSNVTVIEGALADRASVSIHAVDGFGSSETSILAIGNGGQATVAGIGIEEIMRHAGDSAVFVKIDIEGYEFAIGAELERLCHYPVRAMQIAIHPQLLEKSLGGNRLVARLRTALAVWRLGRRFTASFSGPFLTKYSSLSTYILSGIVFRRSPKGADFLFENRSLHSWKRT